MAKNRGRKRQHEHELRRIRGAVGNGICPVHNKALHEQPQWKGIRWWKCKEQGCDVTQWQGSLPADQATRSLRHSCHLLFDPLWQSKHQFINRGDAYVWLAEVMDLPKDKAHIGMFDRVQCEKLLRAIRDRFFKIEGLP